MRAQGAREAARKAIRDADRAEAEAWSLRMEAYGGPAQPSPTIGQCLNGGYGWLEIECCRCKTRASLPLDAIRRARETPIWKLEPSFRCRSCGTRRYKPPVRMIKLTSSGRLRRTSGSTRMRIDSLGCSPLRRSARHDPQTRPLTYKRPKTGAEVVFDASSHPCRENAYENTCIRSANR
jgi:hypothetical protein